MLPSARASLCTHQPAPRAAYPAVSLHLCAPAGTTLSPSPCPPPRSPRRTTHSQPRVLVSSRRPFHLIFHTWGFVHTVFMPTQPPPTPCRANTPSGAPAHPGGRQLQRCARRAGTQLRLQGTAATQAAVTAPAAPTAAAALHGPPPGRLTEVAAATRVVPCTRGWRPHYLLRCALARVQGVVLLLHHDAQRKELRGTKTLSRRTTQALRTDSNLVV